MRKTSKIIASLFGVALLSYANCYANTYEPGTILSEESNSSYEFILADSPWLTSVNPIGIMTFQRGDFSYALASYGYESGGVRNYSDAESSRDFFAESRSIYRISDKVVLSGGISYENFTGENMSGSVWINPYSRPFDIVEFTSENEGQKNLEMYNIDGAVAVQLFEGFTLAGQMVFKSANYAKMKDLRYKSSYSDMDVTVGVGYSLWDRFDIGASYTFSQEVEGIKFSMGGTTDKVYNNLVSFGAFWGTSSTYSTISHNYVKSSTQPYIDLSHSLSLQLSAGILDNLFLYLEGSYGFSSGSYGLDSYSSVVHTLNDNTSYNISGALQYSHNNNRHSLSGSYLKTSMVNYQTIWTESSSNSTTVITYSDPRHAGTTDYSVAEFKYRGDFDIKNITPKWQVELCATLYSRDVFAEQYPFYRRQILNSNVIGASLRYNLELQNTNILNFSLASGYSFGSGTKYYDAYYVTPSDAMTQPRTSEEMLEAEWMYLTSARFAVSPTLGYDFEIMQNIRIFTELRYSYEAYSSFDENRHSCTLRIGCNF